MQLHLVDNSIILLDLHHLYCVMTNINLQVK